MSKRKIDPKNSSLYSLLLQLWSHIKTRRRKQLRLLLVLMIITSFFEIISIGAVIPFLGALTSPEKLFENKNIQPFIEIMGISESHQLLLPLTIIFCLTAIFSGSMRLLLLWANTRLSFATGADISISIYQRTLYQPYSVHCSRNSSEVISGISSKNHQLIYETIIPVMTLISSIIMLLVILAALFVIDPMLALIIFGLFGILYLSITKLTKKKLLSGSQRISQESNKVIKSLQEGLGGIREILLDGNQEIYCKIYRNSDLSLRRAQGNNLLISSSPRFIMETLGIILIVTLAYSLVQQHDDAALAIPILGALALGAQRLLPVSQQIYAAWSSIRGGQASLQDIISLLEQPLPDHLNNLKRDVLSFEHEIRLEQISFRYIPDSPFILNNLDLTIKKGSRVGIVGTTGSGKSTLINIIMGLVTPTTGKLMIDNKLIDQDNIHDWQKHIAHVPQNIFLFDGTIAENIALGIPKDKVDMFRVQQAAQQAQIANSIENWSDQYQTIVGERGIRLSGGQKQRIGIARALYKNASVIIFDEATNALDTETEVAVMQAIESLSKELTIIIIAHRLSTLKNCSHIIELSKTGIKLC